MRFSMPERTVCISEIRWNAHLSIASISTGFVADLVYISLSIFFKIIKPALIETSSLMEALIMGSSTSERLSTTCRLSAACRLVPVCPTLPEGNIDNYSASLGEVSVVMAILYIIRFSNGWLSLSLSLSESSIIFFSISVFFHVISICPPSFSLRLSTSVSPSASHG